MIGLETRGRHAGMSPEPRKESASVRPPVPADSTSEVGRTVSLLPQLPQLHQRDTKTLLNKTRDPPLQRGPEGEYQNDGGAEVPHAPPAA